MTEQNEKDISLYFDECARQGIMNSFAPEDANKLKEALERWDIKPGQHVFEPGCGSGRLTEHLARAVGPEGEVYACDLSREMIAHAKKRNLPEQATFEQGSANTIPRDAGYFDTIICFQVFPHFSDRTHALAEIARVLKSGSDLWIEHFRSRETINSIHRNASHVIEHHRIPSSDEMIRILTDAGFDVSDIFDTTEIYYVHAVKN